MENQTEEIGDETQAVQRRQRLAVALHGHALAEQIQGGLAAGLDADVDAQQADLLQPTEDTRFYIVGAAFDGEGDRQLTAREFLRKRLHPRVACIAGRQELLVIEKE